MVERSYDYNPLRSAAEQEKKRQTEQLADDLQYKSELYADKPIDEDKEDALSEEDSNDYFEQHFAAIHSGKIQNQIEEVKEKIVRLRRELLFTPDSLSVEVEVEAAADDKQKEGGKKKKNVSKRDVLMDYIEEAETRLAKLQQQEANIQSYADVRRKSRGRAESELSKKYERDAEKYQAAEDQLNAAVNRDIGREASPELFKAKIGEENIRDILQNIIATYIEESKDFGHFLGFIPRNREGRKQKQENLQKLSGTCERLEAATGLSKQQIEEIVTMARRQIELEFEEFDQGLEKNSQAVEFEHYKKEKKPGKWGRGLQIVKKAAPPILFYGSIGLAAGAIAPWLGMVAPLGIRALRTKWAFDDKQSDRNERRMNYARSYLDDQQDFERFQEVLVRNLADKKAEQLRAERLTPKERAVAVEFRGLQEKQRALSNELRENGFEDASIERVEELLAQGNIEAAQRFLESRTVNIDQQKEQYRRHMGSLRVAKNNIEKGIDDLLAGRSSYDKEKKEIDNSRFIDKTSPDYREALNAAHYLWKEGLSRQPNHYQELGLNNMATTDEIRQAVGQKLKALDPRDRDYDSRRDHILDIANTLQDPDHRQAYNKELERIKPKFDFDTAAGERVSGLMDQIVARHRSMEDLRDSPSIVEARKQLEKALKEHTDKKKNQASAPLLIQLESKAIVGDMVAIEEELKKLNLPPEKYQKYWDFYERYHRDGPDGLLSKRLEQKFESEVHENTVRSGQGGIEQNVIDQMNTLAGEQKVEAAAQLLQSVNLDPSQEMEHIKEIWRELVPANVNVNEQHLEECTQKADWPAITAYFEGKGVATAASRPFQILMERMQRFHEFQQPHPRTHYDVLGVDRKASAKDIKAAYERVIIEKDPKNPGGDATAFAEVQAAWQALSGGEQKKEYDRHIRPFYDLYIDPNSQQGRDIMDSVRRQAGYHADSKKLMGTQKLLAKERYKMEKDLCKARPTEERFTQSEIDGLIICARVGDLDRFEIELQKSHLPQETITLCYILAERLRDEQSKRKELRPDALQLEADFMVAKATYIQAVGELRQHKDAIETYEKNRQEVQAKLQGLGIGWLGLAYFDALAEGGQQRQGSDPNQQSIEAMLRNNYFSEKYIGDELELWKHNANTGKRDIFDVDGSKAALRAKFGEGTFVDVDRELENFIRPDPKHPDRLRVDKKKVQAHHRSMGYFGETGIKDFFEVKNDEGSLDVEATTQKLTQFFGRDVSSLVIQSDAFQPEIFTMDYAACQDLLVDMVVEAYSHQPPAPMEDARRATAEFERLLEEKGEKFAPNLEAVTLRARAETQRKQLLKRHAEIEQQRKRLRNGEELSKEQRKEDEKLNVDLKKLDGFIDAMDRAATSNMLVGNMGDFYDKYRRQFIVPEVITDFKKQVDATDRCLAEARTGSEKAEQELEQARDGREHPWVKEEFKRLDGSEKKVRELQDKIQRAQASKNQEERRYAEDATPLKEKIDAMEAQRVQDEADLPDLENAYEQALNSRDVIDIQKTEHQMNKHKKKIQKLEEKIRQDNARLIKIEDVHNQMMKQYSQEIQQGQTAKTAADQELRKYKQEYDKVHRLLMTAAGSKFSIAREDLERYEQEKAEQREIRERQRLGTLDSTATVVQQESGQRLTTFVEGVHREQQAAVALYKSEERNQLHHEVLQHSLLESGIAAGGTDYESLKKLYQQLQVGEGKFAEKYDIHKLGQGKFGKWTEVLQYKYAWQEEEKYRSGMALLAVSALGRFSRSLGDIRIDAKLGGDVGWIASKVVLGYVAGSKLAESYAEGKSTQAALERNKMKAEGRTGDLPARLAKYERTYGRVPDFDDLTASLDTWRASLGLAEMRRQGRGLAQLDRSDIHLDQLSEVITRAEELKRIYQLQGRREYDIRILEEKTGHLKRAMTFENNLLLTENYVALQADGLTRNITEFHASEKRFQERKKDLKLYAGLAGAVAMVAFPDAVRYAAQGAQWTAGEVMDFMGGKGQQGGTADLDPEDWHHLPEGLEEEAPEGGSVDMKTEESLPEVLEERPDPAIEPEEPSFHEKEEVTPSSTAPKTSQEETPPVIDIKPDEKPPEQIIEQPAPDRSETKIPTPKKAPEVSSTRGQTIPDTIRASRSGPGDIEAIARTMEQEHLDSLRAKPWMERHAAPPPEEFQVASTGDLKGILADQPTPQGEDIRVAHEPSAEPEPDAKPPETTAAPEKTFSPFTPEQQEDDTVAAVDGRMDRYLAITKEGNIPLDKAKFGDNYQLKQVDFGDERLVLSYKDDMTTIELRNVHDDMKIGERILDKNGNVTEERFFTAGQEEVHTSLSDGGQDVQKYEVRGDKKIALDRFKTNKEGLETYREHYNSEGHLRSAEQSHFENGHKQWQANYNKERLLDGYDRFGYDKEGKLVTVSSFDRKNNPFVWDKVEAHLAGKGQEVKTLETRLKVYDPTEPGAEPLYTVEGEYNRNLLLERDSRVDKETVTWRSGHQTVREFKYEDKDSRPDEIEETLKNAKGDVVGKREVILGQDGRTPTKYVEYKMLGDKEIKSSEHTYEVGPNGQRFHEYENIYDARGKDVIGQRHIQYDRQGNVQAESSFRVDSQGKYHETSRTTYGVDEKGQRYKAEYAFDRGGGPGMVQGLEISTLNEKGEVVGAPRAISTVNEMKNFSDREDIYKDGRLVIDRQSGQDPLQYGYDSKGRVDEMNVLDPKTGKTTTHWEVKRDGDTGEIKKYIRTEYQNNGRTQVITEFDKNGVGSYGYTQNQNESGSWMSDNNTRWQSKGRSPDSLPKLEGKKFDRYQPLKGPTDRLL